MQVAIAEGEDQYVEAVGEPQENRFDGESGDGMPQEAEDRHNEPTPEDAAGAEAHFEQVTGNGQVADPAGPLVGSVPGLVEASTMQTVGNPVTAVALPTQPLSVSGAYMHAQWLARCQVSGSGCQIHRSFTHFLVCRIRAWDIRLPRLGKCCPHR